MGRVSGKVAIVTGAAGGMGKADAMILAQEGAKVVVTDIQEDKVNEVVEEINKNGGEAIGFRHNVTSEEEWQHIVDETVKKWGKIDVLVNNAGISLAKKLVDTTAQDWDKVMAINLTGGFFGLKHVIPVMQKNGGGSIINISSIAGLTGSNGAGPYTASKGAVRMLTKAVAIDYGKDNIRCNSIHPGYIETPMTKDLLADDNMTKWFISNTPLPRLGKPENIAQGVLFLASDESSFITGAELAIDGGVSAR
ncbi:2,5-dichloro-2,5-cyclohexadiene-1,4-diol dehydrogenase [Paenibacillus sp. J23TS9]|uniref:Glucose 1-dehydrogenase n=1 Tax=Paenibacillus dokdonensis TaxID=2567944 RepID=A0ABU6GG69_9BACL|nr:MULTISPECIES: glucose 1-dehydrogenase [Paenibacillus]MEC0238729.1 glucose 1-dehydrogenase [Paenibacillus dokdonensis]GIP27903.1 2,5-dichloro-2,5-cyclohexadiene-1,4-diol dehydrogenase [Paenibacillus sp. J23TS9]